MSHYNHYIAGQWQDSNDVIANINPSDLSDTIGHYAQADTDQLNQAIDAAQSAQKIWAKTGLEARYNALMAIGNELIARAEEIGYILSREEGKTLAEGKGEVYRSGQFFTYFAAQTLRQIGDNADSVRPGIEIDVRREPVGVVGIISPWNFPIATAVWKIAPALAFGNAVIWKPANLVPASAVALTEIIAKQDLPAGLFNLVLGRGGAVGDAMALSAGIDAISFTGSVPVGIEIASKAIRNLTKLQMEMGSKNALVVMDDANMDTAVACAAGGAFGGTGQKCTASSRIIVHRAVHDEFVEKFTQAAQAFKVGHALEAESQIGPVVSEAQLEQNLANVALAQQEGGELVSGGQRLERPTDGYYMSPAVVINTQNDYQVNREELFAPMACVIQVDSYEAALATTNDTEFGLASGIITQNLARATHFRRNAQTGCVMVNLPTAGTDYHVPFGGRGQSSYGPREQGDYAEEFYTTVKTAYIASGEPE